MLNIYGQKNPHDTVIITGTREDLISLRNAISEAAYFDNEPIDFFDSDGEEYSIDINCIEYDSIIMKHIKAPSYYNSKNFN
jgi:hypothetical protein